MNSIIRKLWLGALILPVGATATPSCHDLLITPRVVALAWDERNRLTPLLSEPSERIESHILHQGKNWDYAREGVVVPLALSFDLDTIQLSKEIAWLPPATAQIFARAGRFQTIPPQASETEYSLWMLSPPEGSRRRGRTGILLHFGRPVIATDPESGDEYLVELKGAGLPTGGFATHEDYRALQGGLWEQHGEIEFENLRAIAAPRGPAVRGLGYQRFTTDHGVQETLLRLTPGNRRASYRGPSSLAHTDDQMTALMTSVGQLIGRTLELGYVGITHPENFVTDAAGERVWMTDLLDVFALRDFPKYVDGLYFDEIKALGTFICMPIFFSEFRLDQHWPVLIEALAEAMPNIDPRDLSLMQDLRDPERMNEVPARLLRAGLAERLFRERVRRGYDPFADPKVKQRLNAPCLEPDAEKLGADLTSFFESLSTEPLEEGVEKMLTVLRAEISRYQRGELTFRQWLSQPVTQLLLVLNSSLDFQHTHVQPQAITNVRFFEGLTQNAIPGWLEFKNHLEREHAMLTFALESHPRDPNLLENLARLQEQVEFYNHIGTPDLIDLICDHRAEFLERFRLPYHRR